MLQRLGCFRGQEMNPRRKDLGRRERIDAIEQGLIFLVLQKQIELGDFGREERQRRLTQHCVTRREKRFFAGLLNKRGKLALHIWALDDQRMSRASTSPAP